MFFQTKKIIGTLYVLYWLIMNIHKVCVTVLKPGWRSNEKPLLCTKKIIYCLVGTLKGLLHEIEAN